MENENGSDDVIQNQNLLDVLTYIPGLRRSARVTALIPPERWENINVSLIPNTFLSEFGNDTDVPFAYEEIVTCAQRSKCNAAMQEEAESLESMEVWKLSTLPTGRNTIKTKWEYYVKYNT